MEKNKAFEDQDHHWRRIDSDGSSKPSRISESRHRNLKEIKTQLLLTFLRYVSFPRPTMAKEDPTLPITEDNSPNGSVPKPRRHHWESASSYLRTEITLEHADIPIIACCLVSGLCDSSAYNAWQCFVSMQTGLCSHPLSPFLCLD